MCVCVLFLLKIHMDSFYSVEMSLQSYYILQLLKISITMHEISEFSYRYVVFDIYGLLSEIISHNLSNCVVWK